MNREDDNEALQIRRIHRNSRVREALAEYDRVRARMLAKVEETLRSQYPEGTDVRWTNSPVKGPWYRGHVLEWSEDSTGGLVHVRNDVTGRDHYVSARDILAAGDEE